MKVIVITKRINMKMNAYMPIMAFVMGMSVFYSCQSEKNVPVVGVLTAYYALEDFKAEGSEYKKGQLICDSNDPLNRIVDEDAVNYKYEGDDGGELYSWLLPKSKVEKKTYTMNHLTVSDIGDKAYFVAKNGCVARIFWSNINGHNYFNWNGEEEKYRDEERYKECFVLSVEYISPYSNEKSLFEEQLEEKQGNIELYCKNRFAEDGKDSTDCRYREGLIGFIEESWYNKDGWGYDKTAYDGDGNLLVDQWETVGIADYISIAYIADLNALYVKGQLYYRNNDDSIESHFNAMAPSDLKNGSLSIRASEGNAVQSENENENSDNQSIPNNQIDISSILNECQTEITLCQREIESLCRTFAVLASDNDIDMMRYGRMKITFVNGVNEWLDKANNAFDKCARDLQQADVNNAKSTVDQEKRQFNSAINELKSRTLQQVEMSY